MRTAGIWTLAIASGGILLGALLGSAADPDMKDPPAPWWQQAEDEGADPSAYAFAETDAGRVSPFGGYRPDLDYDAEVWSLPIPEYEMAPLFDEEPVPFADEASAGEHDAAAAADAADDAEAAVDEAIAATIPGSETPEVRKSALAKAGLY